MRKSNLQQLIRMNKSNKWEALSMKDRAFLIRQAVKNGITDIGSIRDTWEHRFDGGSNNSTDNYIETDADHSRDGSWIERLAYNIGSSPAVKDAGKATLLNGDILAGIMNTMVGRQPYNYNDLKAFLGHPEDVGYKKTDDNTGPQFTDALQNYPKGSVQTYKGTINPYNEYIVTDDDYNKFVDMAQRGEIFYSNADMELFDLSNDNYRDDVGNYPIQFVMEDGELYANAADLYDFDVSNWQGRLLTKYGNPYIRRQNKIPVRRIALPEDLLDMPLSDKDSINGIPITDEMKRARNMNVIVKRTAPHLFSGDDNVINDSLDDVALTVPIDPLTITAKPPKLTSREDYEKLGYYAKQFARGNLKREDIPFKYRSHLKQTREEQQKAVSDLISTEKREKERYDNSSTGRFTNFLGNVVTGALAVPALGISAGAVGAAEVGEAITTPGLLTSYEAPFAAKLATDFLGSTIVGEAVNTAARHAGHSSFGDAVHDVLLPDRANVNTLGDNAISSTLEFLNPGYVAGGIGANYLETKGNQLFRSIGQLPLIKKGIKKLTYIPRAYKGYKNMEQLQSFYGNEFEHYFKLNNLYQQRLNTTKPTRPTLNPQYTSFKPYHSNDVNTIQNNIAPYYHVQRISPTEIAISEDYILSPQLTLPVDAPVKLNSLNNNQIILKYLSKKGGRPEIVIPESFSLSNYRNLPDEIYYMLPDDVMHTIKQESLDAAQAYNPNNLSGIKEFGSLATVKEGYLPHISTDADAITSESFYNANIKDRVPLHGNQKTRNGVTHEYKNSKGVTQPLDIVVIKNGSDGLADPTSDVALQLFAKQHPAEYAEAVQQAALTNSRIKIPYTAENLIEGYNPIEDTIFDAFLSSKSKHIGRVPFLMERANPEILQRVITKKGQLMFGKNYTPVRGIDYSNYEDNLEFLAEIGYQGEHIQNLARNPERMKLIGEEYFQQLSSVARGEPKVESLSDWVTRSTIWNPSLNGGDYSGAGKNSVALGNSNVGPYYSSMQIDLNPYLEGKSLKEVIKFSNILKGKEKLPEETSQILSNILGVDISNMNDLNKYLSDLYSEHPTYEQIKNKLETIAKYYPYLEGDLYSSTPYRGFFASPTSGLRFNSKSHTFPFEPMENTVARVSNVGSKGRRVYVDVDRTSRKMRNNNPDRYPDLYNITLEKQEFVKTKANAAYDKSEIISMRKRKYENIIQDFEMAVRILGLTGIIAGGALGLANTIGKSKKSVQNRKDKKENTDANLKKD